MKKLQPINPAIVLIDIRTGRFTREGFQIIQSIRDAIAGEETTAVSLEDLELASLARVPHVEENEEEILPSYAGRLADIEARLDELEATGLRL
jgi:hypothetical protein